MNFAKPIQRLLKPIALTSMLIALAACGGGGGDDSSATVPVNPPPSGDTAKVSGSVAGTTIIALNSSGDIVAIDDNAEKDSDIDSDGDGTLDAFSFALTGIPLTQDIRVFLVIGSGIYPMYFDTNNDGVSDSNVFALASGSTGLALGFIDVNGESGRGIPSNNPVDDNDVTSKGAIAAIPSNINKPPTGGLTFAQLNAKGKNALASGWVLGARAYYLAAEKLAANNAGNDADTARFMLALTRVAALEYDTLSDANAQDMDRLGDLLDLFAFANNETRANWDLIQNPTTLPDDSPTGNDLRNFSYDVVRPELQAAAANLDQVSGSFDAVFTHDGEVLNADHGDALFFSGLFRSIIASIEILRAYDFNVDIDAVQNNEESDPTAEEILASNSTRLGRPDLKKLAEAKGFVWESGKWYHALAEMKNTEFLIQVADGPTLYGQRESFAQETTSGGNGFGIAGPKHGVVEIDNLTISAVKATTQPNWESHKSKLPKFRPIQIKQPKAKKPKTEANN